MPSLCLLLLTWPGLPDLDPGTMTPRSVFLAALTTLEEKPKPRDRLPALSSFLADVHRRIMAGSPAPEEIRRRRQVLLIGLGILFDRSDLLEQTPLAGHLFAGIVKPEEKRRRSLTVDGVHLRGRADATKHFFLSAALTAGIGPFLADRVGRNKEIRDSRRLQKTGTGEGFSFLDLAFNHAGIRYATWLLGHNDPTRLTKEPVSIERFAPSFEALKLPDHLPWKTFQERFYGKNRTAYDAIVRRIHKHIDESVAGE